jgi:hypothetical protein
MHYKLITNEMWMDYKVMDGNPCELTPFIMWPYPILAFLILWQRKIKILIEFKLETWCELTRVKHLPTQNGTCVGV